MAQSMCFLLFWSLNNTLSVGPTCTAVVPLVVKSPESCDCAAVLGADGLDLAFGTGRIQCMAALECKAFHCSGRCPASCLDFCCWTAAAHRKLPGQIRAEGTAGMFGWKKKNNSLTEQENVMIIRFRSFQQLGSWILCWKVCCRYTKLVPPLTFFVLWCPTGILIWCVFSVQERGDLGCLFSSPFFLHIPLAINSLRMSELELQSWVGRRAVGHTIGLRLSSDKTDVCLLCTCKLSHALQKL